MLDYSPALMTDMYEYTMLDACLKDGTANRAWVERTLEEKGYEIIDDVYQP